MLAKAHIDKTVDARTKINLNSFAKFMEKQIMILIFEMLEIQMSSKQL